MSDLKARTQMLYEMFGTGNLTDLDELVAPELVAHNAISSAGQSGPDVFRELIGAFREAFPDLQVAILDMIEDDDRVAVQFTMSGTHTGEFLGVPPTGRAFGITAFDIVRFEDGQAIEHWGQADDLAMLMQLGLLPPP
jgi:steroid delta-isomerase-like uncharacterized protein